MKLFGIPIIVDFSTDTLDKYNRYQELTPEVDGAMDNPDAPSDGPAYAAWHKKMSEQVELYYELKERDVFPTRDDHEPEDVPRPWWKPW